MSYKCEIVAASKNTFGQRITTWLLTMPRFILAELNTHRAFTRNSASSRAIPFRKNYRSVMKHPFIPLDWMKDHTGMQGSHYFTGKFKRWLLRNLWLLARTFAAWFAFLLHKAGLTKQLCNRIIEPFMYHTVLVTATDVENFFALRAHEAAEIHIQKVAYMMLESYNTCEVTQLNEGEWHIPYSDRIDPNLLKEMFSKNPSFDVLDENGNLHHRKWLHAVIKICTAMIARTSYLVVGEEGKAPNYLNDINLHDRLLAQGHMSPFEHIAKPMTNEEYDKFTHTQPMGFERALFDLDTDAYGKLFDGWTNDNHRAIMQAVGATDEDAATIGVQFGKCGNFTGFIQYRKYHKYENRSDARVLKPQAE